MSSLNAFLIFGIAPAFRVNLAELDELYCNLQKLTHPDLSACSSVDSAQINCAYAVLSDPLSRALHLLELHDVRIADHKLDQQFLHYICQENEALESLEGKISLEAFIGKKECYAQSIISKLESLTLPEDLDSFTKLTLELKYISNLLANAKLKAYSFDKFI